MLILNTSSCNWIPDFLTVCLDCQEHLQHDHTQNQRAVCLLLFTRLTHECTTQILSWASATTTVQSQQPISEHIQNQGDDHWDHQKHQILWCSSGRAPDLDCQHQCQHQESSAASQLSEEIEDSACITVWLRNCTTIFVNCHAF